MLKSVIRTDALEWAASETSFHVACGPPHMTMFTPNFWLVTLECSGDLVPVLCLYCRLNGVTAPHHVYLGTFALCCLQVLLAVLHTLKFYSYPTYLPHRFINCLYQPEFLVVKMKTKSGRFKQKWTDRQAIEKLAGGPGRLQNGTSKKVSPRETTCEDDAKTRPRGRRRLLLSLGIRFHGLSSINTLLVPC